MSDPLLQNLIVLLVIIGSIGIAMFFVGGLISALTALGNKQYIIGICLFFCLPLSLLYTLVFREKTAYARQLLFGGLIIMIIGFGSPFLLIDEIPDWVQFY